MSPEFRGVPGIPCPRNSTHWLKAQGWTVIRFWNNEVRENPHAVADAILARIAECLGDTHPQPLPSREGRKRVPRFSD